jgi:hypothetical protein
MPKMREQRHHIAFFLFGVVMSRVSELLKRAEEEHRSFEVEQYREIIERIIPPMLQELKYNAKLCMSRLPAERVKAKFYRDLASLVRRLLAQYKANMEYAIAKAKAESAEERRPKIRD